MASAGAHEQCKGVASQQRHFTAFYLYWFPSEVCLGIRDSHWAREKDQVLFSEGQEILSDESCLLRKRDRSRGLAVHCLLERKNWKCVVKREENIKVSETEKLWLGGAMCKKNTWAKDRLIRSVLSKVLLSERVKFDFAFIQHLYFREVLQTKAFFWACSQLSSKHWAQLEVLASAGRNSSSAGSESPRQCLKSCTCCQSRRDGGSTGLHCNSRILGTNPKALHGCGFVSRLSPFLLMEKLD